MQFLTIFALLIGVAAAGFSSYHSRSSPHSSPRSSSYGHQPLHHNYYAPVHNHYQQGGSGGSGYHASSQGMYHQDKVWRFMIGNNLGPYEYIDEADGYLKGFHPDLVKAVCAEAGKECYWMMDSYDHCWDTSTGIELPGKGLASGWYDGCFGMFPTPERMNSFNFSLPFSRQFKVALTTAGPGGSIGDITDKKIGFVNGWASGKSCVARNSGIPGAKSHKFQAVMYDTFDDMVTGLKKGEADAIVTADAFDISTLGLTATEPWFSCTQGGSSVMAPYGSEIIDWWNDAFTAFRANGGYRVLCDVAKKLHGHRGDLFCLEDETYH